MHTVKAVKRRRTKERHKLDATRKFRVVGRDQLPKLTKPPENFDENINQDPIDEVDDMYGTEYVNENLISIVDNNWNASKDAVRKAFSTHSTVIDQFAPIVQDVLQLQSNPAKICSVAITLLDTYNNAKEVSEELGTSRLAILTLAIGVCEYVLKQIANTKTEAHTRHGKKDAVRHFRKILKPSTWTLSLISKATDISVRPSVDIAKNPEILNELEISEVDYVAGLAPILGGTYFSKLYNDRTMNPKDTLPRFMKLQG